MAKKLLLINPVQEPKHNLACVPILRVPQVGLAYIAALTPFHWDINIIDESVEPLTYEDADLVGITAYTCNIQRAYKIAEQYRRKGIKTVIGGVHASILYEEAINFVDSVVIGEAESVWSDLIHDFESNQLKRYYKGERISLNNLVQPRMYLYKSRKYRVKDVVQTARGCPNDCEFCLVTTLYGRTYRQRPVDELLDELEAIKQKNVFSPDDNILGRGKEAEQRAIRLFKGMIERGLKKRWGSQVGIDFAKNEDVLKYAKKAGCMAVFIGFESLNEEALQSMNKTRNLEVGIRNYKEIIQSMTITLG
ncbi:MAG: cobalamin-dependent protein [Thermodesulfobacteriota bacterium]|nr:cobalamin-dependent protein [Thermodesulfobacteriota bacterium]